MTQAIKMTHQELKAELIMQKGKSKDLEVTDIPKLLTYLEVTDICTFVIFLRAQKMNINNKNI